MCALPICFALALSLLLSLIPTGIGRHPAALAETKRLGITLDKVNMRYGAGTGEKIAFSLPKDHVCEIVGEKDADKIHWYRVRTIDPSRKNSNTYFGYIHGGFFRELTDEEYALMKKHVEIGSEVMAGMDETVPDLYNGIRHHHER